MCQGGSDLAELRRHLDQLQLLAGSMEQATRQWHAQALELQRALGEVEAAVEHLEQRTVTVTPIAQTRPATAE